MADETRSGLLSLRALGRGLLGVLFAAAGSLLVTGSALGRTLVPVLLGIAAIGYGIGVFALDPKPKARWRGMGVGAIVAGSIVVLAGTGVLNSGGFP